MSKLGIHFPNAGFRNLDALWSIPWQSFAILHLNRDWVPEIRLRFPHSRILVRAYTKNWTTLDPLEWAREIARWADELRPFGIEITFANEQNLAAEGHPLGARPGNNYPPASVYQDILNWDTAVIRELRRLLPWAMIHFPALSLGHSDDQADAGYIGFEILREAVQMCDVLDAHIYWDEGQPEQRKDAHYGERYRLLHSLFPGKPIFISECGAIPPSSMQSGVGVTQWLEALPDYVVGACWFIWDSDAMNQSWILRDKPVLAAALRSYQLAAAAPSVPDSVVGPVEIAMALLMGWEGFSATPHEAAGRIQVIGYGHRMQPSETFRDLISESDAKTLLQSDLAQTLQRLQELTKAPLTANQKAALLSLVYDFGVDELRGSALWNRVNDLDAVGAALEWKQWHSSNGSPSADILRRRQMESELFLRDVIPSANASAGFPVGPASPVQCTVSATATWVSVKQGECYQVIGVWCSEDAPIAVANASQQSSQVTSTGRVMVRVEDKSGVGIAGELVTRRWDNPKGECEPRVSDPSGMVWFELGDSTRFDPGQAQGPDRIQVGDCVIAGLGKPSYGTGGTQPIVHSIRIRKLA